MRGLVSRGALTALLAAAALPVGAAPMKAPPPSLQDSFRLGSGNGVLCRVQANLSGPAIKSMFDRAYTIVCRDAAAPVGHLYALHTGKDDPLARLAATRDAGISCQSPAPATVADLAGTSLAACMMTKEQVGYSVYSVTKGDRTYVAEGLAGYDDALQLGLRTIVADRMVPGEIQVATTSISDPAAFARVQAGSLDPALALAEGYRRNNSGSYAEASEFFDALVGTASATPQSQSMLGEYIVNRALQRSNLGDFAEADALFAEAAKIRTGDPVQLRLRRNFYALHLLNQGKVDEARAALDRPITPVMPDVQSVSGAPVIDAVTAAQVNTDSSASLLAGQDPASLTPVERSEILDAQAEQLRGSIARLKGDDATAEQRLNSAIAQMLQVREGRVTTIARLRAQALAELSAIAEKRGDFAIADRDLRDGLAIVQLQYPGSAAENAAKARLAGYLARRGQPDASIALYRQVVQQVAEHGGDVGLEHMLAPYFAVLADQVASHPALAEDMFLASQTLVRPGVADTQAELARELSGGSDAAARLFRQSTALTREVEADRVEVARLSSLAKPSPDDLTRLASLKSGLAGLEADQVATQAKLGQFPRYRAVSNGTMTLADLQKVLKPDEAYYKLAIVERGVYAIYVTPSDVTAYRADINAKALDKLVTTVRDSVIKEQDGRVLTYPFDLERSRALFIALMGPIQPKLAGVKHLVFEPDGPMLGLPATVLVTDDAGVAAYKARVTKPKADEFDFRGIAWLGKQLDVSTAVSAASFRDVRRIAPSNAPKPYLGLGHNAPVTNVQQVSATRAMSNRGAIDCDWPLENWDNPIPANELYTADKSVGGKGDVITGQAFSDTAIIERGDLSQYRILHFATHGLLTAPRPECPARPALLTSFGPALPDGKTSDGLLSFREIYGLKLDADIVILSACDTAGAATVAATREAGVTTGGGSELDGLVRAFVGAGSRSVLASYWPVPNDFNATQRLISGLFEVHAGTSIGDAMRQAELKLMDDENTSHPYYWSGFAIIGDGAQPVLRPL